MVTFWGYETRADLLLLDMINFEVILGMDWLSLHHDILHCHTKTVTLATPELPRLEWKGSSSIASRQVISFLKAQHMVEKGCLAYMAFVQDTVVEIPILDSVPVAREFSDVFPTDLQGMPLDLDFYFAIDLAPGTQTISIPPYYMALMELRELNEHVVSGKGMKVDPRKINVVQSWPRPTTTTETRSFLGLLGYYRQFVDGFSSITAQLTRLTQKGVQFRLSDDHEASYQKLKTALTTTLRNYLYGVSSEVYTNNRSLQHLLKHKDLNLRQNMWLVLLKDYDITILYHSGKTNMVTDALSRKAESMGSLVFYLAEEKLFALDIYSLAKRLVRLDISKPSHIVLWLSLLCLRRLRLFDPNKARFYGTDLVKDALDKIKLIQGRLCIAQSRKKSYVNQKTWDLSFMVGDKYHADMSYVFDYSTSQMDEGLSYEEEPVAIVDRQVHKLRSKEISTVKI
uniref:Reverse transcriptase n=1 Tax=Nicotiana tabacum TaxID=4097 RepID=A0A1S3Z0G7_TOBAC|nr:PREDICTED: uncharacterized protein LOC107781722 [Nicotiana tabacum]